MCERMLVRVLCGQTHTFHLICKPNKMGNIKNLMLAINIFGKLCERSCFWACPCTYTAKKPFYLLSGMFVALQHNSMVEWIFTLISSLNAFRWFLTCWKWLNLIHGIFSLISPKCKQSGLKLCSSKHSPVRLQWRFVAETMETSLATLCWVCERVYM